MCGAELSALPEGVQRVARFLVERSHAHSPLMLDDAARTAQQAADGLGVALGQIAKSIIFKRKPDEAAVLVITSGDRRVDEKAVQALTCADGQRLGRADADFVKARTGFSIGGVAPVAHAGPVLALIDISLFRFDEVWAAAGHPHAVFRLSPGELEALTGAPVVDVAAAEASQGPGAATSGASPAALLADRARSVQLSAPDAVVPSPCLSVCRIDAARGVCEGCFRTLDEIARWGGNGPQAQRAVWAKIASRIDALTH